MEGSRLECTSETMLWGQKKRTKFYNIIIMPDFLASILHMLVSPLKSTGVKLLKQNYVILLTVTTLKFPP